MFDTTAVLSASSMVVFAVCGAWVASHVPFFKKRQVRQGILLGLMAFSAVFFLQKDSYLQSCIAFMDFPVLISGLFFGPVACLVSTAAMLIVKIMLELYSITRSIGWLEGCLASLLVCGYAVCVSKISFANMRPTVFTGFIAAAFGECVHLAFVFVIGMDTPGFTCRVISDLFFTMVLGAGLAAALFALICPREDGSKRFFAKNSLPFFVFGVAYILVLVGAIEAAKAKVLEMLKNGARDFNQTISEHVAFSMHRSSASICKRIGNYAAVTQELLAKLAEAHSLDEVNIVGTDGFLYASSSGEIHKYKGTYQAYPENLRFRQSVKRGDTKTVVRKTFRPSLKVPYEDTCFIEIPFPDRNAFLKPGYSEKSFNAEFRQIFIPHMAEKAIGTNGYYLIIDKEGKIAGPVHGHPDAINEKAESVGLSPDHASQPLDKVFNAYLFGEKTVGIRFRKIGNLDVYACFPIYEIFNPVLMIIAIAGLALLGLSFLFNWMMQRVDKVTREKEEHLKNELIFAHNIQMAELKEKTPDTDRYKISALMLPAKVVGGDFYDFYELDGRKVLLGIGDVSGKGMPAAFFMMKMKTALKLCNFCCGNMKDAVDLSNNEVCNKNESMMFVTAFGSIFDSETGILDFVCAGHNPPLIIRADGTVEWLKCEHNLPMGVRPGVNYKAQQVHLNHNDRLFLYTDGVTESRNAKGELYGSWRLKKIVEKMYSGDDLIGAVVQDVKKFCGEMEQADDITMLTMLYR